MELKVSLICTVLNEGAVIQKLLYSILEQSRPPDEIIFVDGGSRDNTVATLKNFAQDHDLPLRVIEASGANISQGRNIAIAAALGPIIASTDAGVRLAPDWLEALVKPFQGPSPPVVVSGFFVADPQTPFEVAMGATVLPLVSEIKPATFLPSSRSVAFLKSGWEAAGHYPEWLDYGEDLIFDFRLRDEIGAFIFAPKAVVYFRPRHTLRAFFRQYYLYARGDGKADLWRKRHAIRYSVYLLGLPLLVLLGGVASPWIWLCGAVLGAIGLFLRPYSRLFQLWHGLSGPDKARTILWVPIIRITGDIAKMVGYPVGWRWRLHHLPSNPQLRWRNE